MSSWIDADLDRVEQRDPTIRAAKRAIYHHPEAAQAHIERHERHMAARRAVGKRPLPEDEL